jgi:hypothetical protein
LLLGVVDEAPPVPTTTITASLAGDAASDSIETPPEVSVESATPKRGRGRKTSAAKKTAAKKTAAPVASAAAPVAAESSRAEATPRASKPRRARGKKKTAPAAVEA